MQAAQRLGGGSRGGEDRAGLGSPSAGFTFGVGSCQNERPGVAEGSSGGRASCIGVTGNGPHLAPAAGVSEAAAPGRQTSLPHGAAEVCGDEGPAAALPANAPTAAAASASPAPRLPARPTCGLRWAAHGSQPGYGSGLCGPCPCWRWGSPWKLGPL